MIFWIKFILVMASVCGADICWAKYMIHVNKGNALMAALWSSGIVIVGSISFFGYIEDKRFIFASIIGAFIGTYITVNKK